MTHVSIAEYAARNGADQSVKDRLSTIEGRFGHRLPISLKASESEGYHLLGSQRHWRDTGLALQQQPQSQQRLQQLSSLCSGLPLFQSVAGDMEHIILESYPLHPLTAAALFTLSAQFSQANRTAFTFTVKLNRSYYSGRSMPMARCSERS